VVPDGTVIVAGGVGEEATIVAGCRISGEKSWFLVNRIAAEPKKYTLVPGIGKLTSDLAT
jgi:hypothetical protein